MTNEELALVKKNYNDAKSKSAFLPKQNKNEVVSMSTDNDVFQDDLIVENKARAEFGSSISLREEFGNIDRYIAYRKAEVRGGMKILGNVVVRGQS